MSARDLAYDRALRGEHSTYINEVTGLEMSCPCLDCGALRAEENLASLARTVTRWENEGEPARIPARPAALVDGPPLGGGIQGLQARSLYARTVY